MFRKRQDENAPTVLIVESPGSDAMSIQRLTNIFKIKDFNIEVCQDGDKAVDEYIRIDNPELVLISLDIPSLDGHIAALEMREHGGDARNCMKYLRTSKRILIVLCYFSQR